MKKEQLARIMKLAIERAKIPATEEEIKQFATRIREMESKFEQAERSQVIDEDFLNKTCNI